MITRFAIETPPLIECHHVSIAVSQQGFQVCPGHGVQPFTRSVAALRQCLPSQRQRVISSLLNDRRENLLLVAKMMKQTTRLDTHLMCEHTHRGAIKALLNKKLGSLADQFLAAWGLVNNIHRVYTSACLVDLERNTAAQTGQRAIGPEATC